MQVEMHAISRLRAPPAPVELNLRLARLVELREAQERLDAEVLRAVAECDAVLLSGGTSKGAGDVSYRVAGELGPPGIVAHGVALKPGKPLCLAVAKGTLRPIPVFRRQSARCSKTFSACVSGGSKT